MWKCSCVWEIGFSSPGKDKAFSLESLAEWLPALSPSGTQVTAGQKINDILTYCLAQAEPVSPRRWRGSGAGGYPGPFTAGM